MSIQALNTVRSGRFDVGNVLGAVGEAFRRHFLVLFALTLLLYGAPLTVSGALQQAVLFPLMAGDPAGWIRSPSGVTAYFGVVAINFIASYVVQAALIQGVVGSLLRRPVSFSDCLAIGLRYLLPSMAIAVLFGVAVTIGLLLLIVPGVFLAIGWIVAVPAMVVERRGPLSALRRSWQLTEGFRGKILLLLVIWIGINIGFGLVTGMITFLFNMILAAAGTDVVAWFTNLVLVPVLSSVLMLASGAGVAATYFELRTAREGFGAEDLAVVFA